MSTAEGKFYNYLENPYKWRTHYTELLREVPYGNQYRNIHFTRQEILRHTFGLLFPGQELNFDLECIDSYLFEYSIYYHFGTNNPGTLSQNFMVKCLTKFSQLKREVSMAAKNPSALKKPVEKTEKKQSSPVGKPTADHMRFIINLVCAQKQTDEEILAATAKAFPEVKQLLATGQSLSHVRWHLNNGKTKIDGKLYVGKKLVRIVKEVPAEKKVAAKPAAVKAPAKTPAKTPAKAPAKTAKIPAQNPVNPEAPKA